MLWQQKWWPTPLVLRQHFYNAQSAKTTTQTALAIYKKRQVEIIICCLLLIFYISNGHTEELCVDLDIVYNKSIRVCLSFDISKLRSLLTAVDVLTSIIIIYHYRGLDTHNETHLYFRWSSP